MRLARFLLPCFCLAQAGCQEQRTTVVEQSSSANLAALSAPQLQPTFRPPPPSPQFSPCTAPAGTGPFEHLTRPVRSLPVPMPPLALADHVNGCAGVKFRIGPDGIPVDIIIEAEYPAGYGFGAAARDAVAEARWPQRDDMAWRYLVVNMHPGSRPG